jgi:uncharacterized membrane protein
MKPIGCTRYFHALTAFVAILTLSFSPAIPSASAQAPPLFLSPATYYSGGDGPYSVAVSDVNGDGAPDVVVAHFCEPNRCQDVIGGVGVLLNRGDGTLLPAVSYASGGFWATSVAIADVNGDHKPDLVVANCGPVGLAACQTGNAVVGVLLGNGDGTFQSALVYESGGEGAFSIGVSDVNGDGKPDLLVAHIGGSSSPDGEVGVLLGNGDGSFQTATTYATFGGTYWLAAADVNHDGKPDLLVSNNGGSVGVLLGNGDGTFQPVSLYNSGGPNTLSIVAADVNGDGNLDLLVATADARTSTDQGAVSVLLGNRDGTFEPAVSYSSGGVGAWSVAIADVNQDSALDVLVTNFFDTTVGLLLGNGDGTFQSVTTYDSGGSGPVSLAIADMNRDGRPDLIVAGCALTGCAGKGQVALLLHVGNTSTTTTLASSPNPSSFGQAVTFNAAVTSKAGTPTGAVKFLDKSTVLGTSTIVNGSASIPYSALVAGSHSITAVYQGSLKFNSSVSAPLTQNVKNARAETSTVVVSSLNPSIRGDAVTFTATVRSPGGIPPNYEYVTFRYGLNVLGKAGLIRGIASLTTSSLPAGISTITALYPGDANFASSVSSELLQVINSKTQFRTATTLTSSLNPAIYGQKVTWMATVTTLGSTVPTGKVNFTSDRYFIGAATLNANGVATLTKSYLNAGAYPLTAVYVGDATNGPSVSVTLNQVVKQTTSKATLSSFPAPSSKGQAVTFTTKITSPTVIVTGPVTFSVGTTVLGTIQLLGGGYAKFTTSTLPVGATTVKVTYYGNSNIAKSSASLVQTVQ